jgi:hypothetical protein
MNTKSLLSLLIHTYIALLWSLQGHPKNSEQELETRRVLSSAI